jgi:polysaccharide export outer membrane protein
MKKYLPIILLTGLFFCLNPIGLINVINEINQINEKNQIDQNVYAQNPNKHPASADMPENYIIGKGDVLRVFVWRNEQLSSEVVVRPDGKVSLPLLQDLQADGLTVLQLKEEITRRFSEHINNPRVTVMVNQINSCKVSVLGKVTSPGVYPITGDTTLIEAISMAGGFTEWANKRKITVITHQGGKKKKVRVNYKKIISGKDPSQNIILKRGDTIIVP